MHDEQEMVRLFPSAKVDEDANQAFDDYEADEVERVHGPCIVNGQLVTRARVVQTDGA